MKQMMTNSTEYAETDRNNVEERSNLDNLSNQTPLRTTVTWIKLVMLVNPLMGSLAVINVQRIITQLSFLA